MVNPGLTQIPTDKMIAKAKRWENTEAVSLQQTQAYK